MSPRYVGIDYGTRRIGLAVSDPLGTLASPLRTLQVKGGAAEQVRQVVAAAQEFDVDEWVVGHPFNMDGTEGPQAKTCGAFAELLARQTGTVVHLWDERLSSAQADEYLAQAALTQKKKKSRRDMLAAQIILQSFLDAQPQH